MANNHKWTEEEERKLLLLWGKAQKDRDKFKTLILADKLLGNRRWKAVSHKAYALGLYEKSEISSRYPFSRLSNELKEELKRMLSDPAVSWEKIRAEKEFSKFNEKQLRNFAQGEGISIDKGGDKMANHSSDEKGLTPEQQFIAKREAGEISIEEFLNGLAEIKSELAEYWEIIHRLVSEKKMVRNTDFLPFTKNLRIQGKKKEHKLNAIRGILRKFEEWETLSSFKTDLHIVFLCNMAGFYRPEELFKLIPPKETKLITSLLTEEPQELKVLASKLEKVIGHNLLSTLLEHYMNLGLVKFVKKADGYCLTERGKELGVDAQSIKTLEATALENALFVEQEEAGTLPKSLQEVGEALERDMAKKIVPVTDLSAE
ncbi:MAG: hypothetical protein AAB884_01980, partial [Patescibacteria group bacterium]